MPREMCTVEVACGIWNSSSVCEGLHLVLQLRFVPGRAQEWQRSNLAARSPGAQICESPRSALGLAKVVEGLV